MQSNFIQDDVRNTDMVYMYQLLSDAADPLIATPWEMEAPSPGFS
jgi:hypothetical protein